MPALDLFMALQTPVPDGGGTARAPAGRQAGQDAVFAGLLALAADPGTGAAEAPRAATPPATGPQPDAAVVEEPLDLARQAKSALPSETAAPNPDEAARPADQGAAAAAPAPAREPEDARGESEDEIERAVADGAEAAVPTPPAPTPVPTPVPVNAPEPRLAADVPANETADQAGDGAEPPAVPAQTAFKPAAAANAVSDPRGAAAAVPKAVPSPAAPDPGVQAAAANAEKPDSAGQDDQAAVTTAAARAAAHGTAHAPAASMAQPTPPPLPAEAGRRLETPAIAKTAPERSGDARAGDGSSAPAATPDGARNASPPPAPAADRNPGQGPSSGGPGAGGPRAAGPPAESPPAPADAAMARSEPPAPGRDALPVPPPAEAAPAPAPGAAAGLARATLETTAMMAAQIVRRLESRSTRFEMALTPEGLGRVDVRMEIDGDGQLTARLAFDNPAAAAELRGRVDDLRRQLEASGFQIGEDALEFTEREGGRDQPFDRHFADREPGRAFAGAGRLIDDPSVLPPPTRWAALTLTPEGVDMKV